MQPRQYRTEGIILKRQNFGEADRVLTVFTLHHGKIRCLAKGVRKPTSRKSASVELFNRITLFLAKGRNIDILTQTETLENFPGIRKNLKAVKAAYHCVELVERMTAENQEHPLVLEELLKMLRRINQKQHATRGEIVAFEKKILQELGFGLPKEQSSDAVRQHIESIIERKLNSAEVFKDV